MTQYRKWMGVGGGPTEVWHWRRECTHWPLNWYEEHEFKPADGEFCSECASIEAREDVEPVADAPRSSD